MREPGDWLVHDHSVYEELLLDCIDAVEHWDWASANQKFKNLVSHVEGHMAMEEGVLYPAYEKLLEVPQEPIRALREEHRRLTELIRDMKIVMQTMDADHVLESLLPLKDVMFKHHEKEESIFLPMAGHFLADQKDDLIRQLQDFQASYRGKSKSNSK